jgi:hypothetical protein
MVLVVSQQRQLTGYVPPASAGQRLLTRTRADMSYTVCGRSVQALAQVA